MDLFRILQYVLDLEEDDLSREEMIDLYCSNIRFGRIGYGDPNFMRRCEEHKRVLVKLENQVEQFEFD